MRPDACLFTIHVMLINMCIYKMYVCLCLYVDMWTYTWFNYCKL